METIEWVGRAEGIKLSQASEQHLYSLARDKKIRSKKDETTGVLLFNVEDLKAYAARDKGKRARKVKKGAHPPTPTMDSAWLPVRMATKATGLNNHAIFEAGARGAIRRTKRHPSDKNWLYNKDDLTKFATSTKASNTIVKEAKAAHKAKAKVKVTYSSKPKVTAKKVNEGLVDWLKTGVDKGFIDFRAAIDLVSN